MAINRRRRLMTAGVVLGLATGMQVALGAAPAAAATAFAVTTTADIGTGDGACGSPTTLTAPDASHLSLREATCLANNNGGTSSISIPAGHYTLISGELAIGTASGQDVTLTGTGSPVIDGNGNSRVLDFDPNLEGGVTGAVSGLTITGGADSTFGGAGIIGGSGTGNIADKLTITDSIVTDNHANGAAPDVTNNPGGGVQFIGGTLTITDSKISHNSSKSSPGSGVMYAGTGFPASESLTVTGTTFSDNAATDSNGSSVTNGGALDVRGLASTGFSVTDSVFDSNSVVATTGGAVGAGIRQESGALTVTGTTFTGNSATGTSPAGGAVEVTSGTATLNYNRFHGNSATLGSAIHVGSGTVAATENWFGCNGGPGAGGCDTVAGGPSVSPRLILTADANPSTVGSPHQASTLTAGFLKDSNGASVAGAHLSAFDGADITWTDPQPSGATVNGHTDPVATAISSGQATASYDSGTGAPPGHVIATFDNEALSIPIDIVPNAAPTFTSSGSAHFLVGSSHEFDITTSGNPAVTSITKAGALPTGLTFQDNGDGTANITGTPAVGTGGSTSVTLTASNGASTTQQTLTINVDESATITSADHTAFVLSAPSTFTVTTGAGYPSATAITHTTGTLPPGILLTDAGNGTATLAGTPTQTGSYVFGLQAANTGTASPATQQFTLTVNPPVAQAPQTITFDSTPPAPPTVGADYPVSATSDSGLPVSLTIDPATTNFACSMAASTVHFDHAGTCVVDANQSGDSTHLAAPQVQQTIEVAKVVTSLDVQSSLTPTVYGQAAHATATVSADSGTPAGAVQFAVDGHSLGVPVAVAGGQAQSIDLVDENGHPLAPAAHPVTATFTPTDTNTYEPADGSTTQVVAQADTKLVLTVQPTTVTATVTAVSPGAGTPSGLVTFAVSGTPVGTAQLSGGIATLTYTVPAGKTQNVSATYAHDTNFTGTSGSTARHDPTIVAHLTSAQAKTRFGWYRSAVKVTFTCTTHGASLVTPCPGAVNLTHAGAAQSVTRTITATDGGTATAAVHGINIDLTKPAVVVTGVRNGGVYRGWPPRARCVATDQLSGVASCVLTQTVKKETVTYKATATDKAGNVSTATGSYRVLAYFLKVASFDGTTYSVKVGHTYTLVVLSADRPALYAAVPYPGTPTKLVGNLHPAGHNLWAIGVTITQAMKSPQQWNLGVKFAKTMHLVRIKVSP